MTLKNVPVGHHTNLPDLRLKYYHVRLLTAPQIRDKWDCPKESMCERLKTDRPVECTPSSCQIYVVFVWLPRATCLVARSVWLHPAAAAARLTVQALNQAGIKGR